MAPWEGATDPDLLCPCPGNSAQPGVWWRWGEGWRLNTDSVSAWGRARSRRAGWGMGGGGGGSAHVCLSGSQLFLFREPWVWSLSGMIRQCAWVGSNGQHGGQGLPRNGSPAARVTRCPLLPDLRPRPSGPAAWSFTPSSGHAKASVPSWRGHVLVPRGCADPCPHHLHRPGRPRAQVGEDATSCSITKSWGEVQVAS